MDDNPLSLIETKKLLEELHSRFDGMVFIASAERTTEEDKLVLSLHGSFHMILGLIETAKLSLTHAGADDDDSSN